MRLVGYLPPLVAGLAASGCARPPLEGACPDVAAGDLVVTEVRGEQSGDDTWGQWIEIYNAGGAAVALGGLLVRQQKLDGSSPVEWLVRDAELELPAGGYAVIGRFGAGMLPAHVDYGYAADFAGDLYGDAILEISACGELVDRVTWTGLPGAGTWALGGAPSATANDSADAWCEDARPASPPPPDQLGLPGSPGQENPTCP